MKLSLPKINTAGYLLLPFSAIYYLITRVRNHLYNIEFKKSVKFDANVIGVGNLTVGGTGKTPLIEYLIEILKGKYKVATLSRGYGRKTKGFRIANNADSPRTIGDEPYQIFLKNDRDIIVTVCEERALAIPEILANYPENDVILLDDAFQHRKVVPSLNILLTDYNRLFYNDIVLPSGRLRESRSGAKRAHVIIVTKCPPEITKSEMYAIKHNIQIYSNPSTPIFFTSIKYNNPKPVFNNSFKECSNNVLLFSGIAHTTSLRKYVGDNFNIVKELEYSDHYHYTTETIQNLVEAFEKIPGPEKSFLTTEKDMVKLLQGEIKTKMETMPVFYLPIQVSFIEGELEFQKTIFNAIDQRERNEFEEF